MNALRGVLLAVRLVLELAALVALGYWGFATAGNAVLDVILGLGAPLLAAVVWGLFVSPKARYGTPVRQALFEALVFGAAILALIHAGQPWPALAFGATAVVDSILLRLLDRDLSPA